MFQSPQMFSGSEGDLISVTGDCLINRLREILNMEVEYNFLDKFLINTLLIPRG